MRAYGDLVVLRAEGLYCPAGDFYIDPWRPVPRALITHGHADHARAGHRAYLAAAPGAEVLRARLGSIPAEYVAYGSPVRIGAATVSFHPAGHVLGSAQIRIEEGGQVWVVSGDYKVTGTAPASGAPDPTCTPFEPVRADVFVTESTFGLPIYRWRPQEEIMAGVDAWWAENAAAGRTSIVYAYALGKAQRILASLPAHQGPIVCHGAVEAVNEAYRRAGVTLPATLRADDLAPADRGRALVIAPPSAAGSPWEKRFPDRSDAFASGWMQVRGNRRRQSLDRGFVLSDHADWPGLLWAIGASGATRVIVTHGQVAPLVRWLSGQGIEAQAFQTEFGDEEGAAAEPAQALQETS